MSAVTIRPAIDADLPRLTEIYNYYVINTPITFDLRPFEPEQRAGWFRGHSSGGRYRLFVAEDAAHLVCGFAGTGQHRAREAYDTTVESTIYCSPEATGQGVGTALYSALFEALADEDIYRIVAGVTLPNPASVALHRHFGFRQVGVFSANGRKFGRYWDVAWFERPLILL
jgi:phosphinothricin acetyltransferase